MEEHICTELEAAAFRRLVGHLRERADLQNIDLMELPNPERAGPILNLCTGPAEYGTLRSLRR